MEIIVGIIIGITIALLTGRRKNKCSAAHRKNINTNVNKNASVEDKKRQIDEEIVTVILPTINNK